MVVGQRLLVSGSPTCGAIVAKNMEPEDAARRVGRVEEVLARPVAEMAAGAAERRASFVAF